MAVMDWLLKKLNTKEAQVTKLEIDKVAVELDEDEIKESRVGENHEDKPVKPVRSLRNLSHLGYLVAMRNMAFSSIV